MPIRDNEKFCVHFVADTKEEAEELLSTFHTDLTMQAHKFSAVTGVDKLDLYQEGVIGLARASRDFEENRSVNFRIFALYKIKDAMREFVTRQSSDVKVPQYIRDAQRLAVIMRAIMEKAGYIGFMSSVDLWHLLVEFTPTNKSEEALKRDMESVRDSLANLAERSHTSVPQILDRAEMMPTSSLSTIVDLSIFDTCEAGHASEEDKMLGRIYARDMVEKFKEVLTEEEFELLCERFVEGKTLTSLVPDLGIKEESIVVKTNNIVAKLKRKFDDEAGTNTKEIRA